MNSKALSKFDRVLRCFTPAQPRWTVTDIARHMDMPVSTLHGILADMVEMDFLSFSPQSKEYGVGFRYMEMGALHSNNFELNNIAVGIMHELVFRLDYLVGLSVMYKGWMYVSTTVLPLRSTRGLKYVGPRLPAHMSAGGIAILSRLSDELVRRYCALDWEGSIISSPRVEELEKALEEARRCGYARSHSFAPSEMPANIAVPVSGRNGQVIAAIVIVGHDEGLPVDKFDYLVEKLTFSANEISMRCGHISQTHGYV